jgi:hypothetical protein
VSRSDSPLAGVAAAMDEGRVIGSEAALVLAEAALAEHRRVQAHSNAHVMQRIGNALGVPVADEVDDEFSSLFNPNSPLGPPEPGHVEYPPSPRVYEPKPRASARWADYPDERLHADLFGTSYYGPPGGRADECGVKAAPGWRPRHVRAGPGEPRCESGFLSPR